MATTSDVQDATLKRLLDAMSRWNAEDFLGTFADDFEQISMPFSMGAPPRTIHEVQHVVPILMGLVTDQKVSYQLTVHHTIQDFPQNKAAVYLSSEGGTPWGPWKMEYAMFITFTDSGNKVARLEEMLDSAYLQWFGPHFENHLKEKGIIPV